MWKRKQWRRDKEEEHYGKEINCKFINLLTFINKKYDKIQFLDLKKIYLSGGDSRGGGQWWLLKRRERNRCVDNATNRSENIR